MSNTNKIQLKKNKSYNFQVSYIGMATFSQLILSKEEDIVKNIKLNENNEVERVGGVKYTISNGVIYDSKGLLNQVKMMVDKAKKEEGFEIKQPGVN